MDKLLDALLLSKDKEAVELITQALKTSDYKVLRRRRKKEFAIIIVDLDDNNADPFKEIKDARKRNADLGIIALGKTGSPKKMVRAIKAGADEYLWKPVIPEQAALVAARFSERHKLEIQAREAEFYRNLANTDELTGLYNYRFFHQHLDAEISRSVRLKNSVCLLMLDIDFFKDYNDFFGHMAGDEVLKQIAGILGQQSRIYDTVARYGGEEFTVIAPEKSKAASEALGLRLMNTVAEFAFKGEEKLPDGKLTISVGIASFPEDATTKMELLERADQALYTAKRRGRNRVVMWGD